MDETIRDQLIEKCRDGRLRRKFLEKPNATLKDLQDIARSHEAVDAQMESMSKAPVSSRDQVNSVKQQKFQTEGRGRDPKKGGPNIKSRGPKACYNCNPWAISQGIRVAQLRIKSVESVELVNILRSVVETRNTCQVARRGPFQKIRRRPS